MKIQLADNHCHLIKEYFDDPVSEIERLNKLGLLDYVVSVGLNLETDAENLSIKMKVDFPDFFRIGLGFHPGEVVSLGKLAGQELERIIELIEDNADDIDVIGEIGIDYTYENSKDFADEQKNVFRKLCEKALELKKPVSVHIRDSFDEVIEILDAVFPDTNEFKGYIHCFTGNFEQAMFFIEKGFKLGLGGIITYKKSEELRSTVKQILDFYEDKDFNDIFGLETDAPYLTPEPNRSEKNKSENVKIIAEYIEENISNSK